MPVQPLVQPFESTLQVLLLRVLPSGGQRGARRNAWASMSSDAVRARARREAAEAVARAESLARSRSAHPASAQRAVAAR